MEGNRESAPLKEIAQRGVFFGEAQESKEGSIILMNWVAALRNALPENAQRGMLGLGLGIAPRTLRYSAFRHTVPTHRTLGGVSRHTFFIKDKDGENSCVVKVFKIPHLSPQEHENTAERLLGSARAVRDWYAKQFPEIPTFAAQEHIHKVQLRMSGRSDVLAFQPPFTILKDLCIRTEQNAVDLLHFLRESSEGIRTEFLVFVKRLELMFARGVFPEMIGDNNVVIARTKKKHEPHIRMLDTYGVLMFPHLTPAEEEGLRKQGIPLFTTEKKSRADKCKVVLSHLKWVAERCG